MRRFVPHTQTPHAPVSASATGGGGLGEPISEEEGRGGKRRARGTRSPKRHAFPYLGIANVCSQLFISAFLCYFFFCYVCIFSAFSRPYVNVLMLKQAIDQSVLGWKYRNIITKTGESIACKTTGSMQTWYSTTLVECIEKAECIH